MTMNSPELFKWDEHPQQFYPELPHIIYADIPCGPLPKYWWHISHDRAYHSFTEWVYTDPEHAANHLLHFPLDPFSSYEFKVQNVESGRGSYAFAWKFGWGLIVNDGCLYRGYKEVAKILCAPTLPYATEELYAYGMTDYQQEEYDKKGWVDRRP